MTSANVSQIPVMAKPVNVKGAPKQGDESRDFMQIMSASMSKNSASDIRSSVGVAAPVKGQEQIRPVSQDNKPAAADLKSTDVTDKKADFRQPVNMKNIDGTGKEAEVMTDEEIEAATEAMAVFAAEITEVIADELNVTVEDVTNAMDELEIMPTDLIDPKNLSDLIVEITDMNRADMLTSPVLGEISEDIEPLVDDLLNLLPVEDEKEIPGFAADFLKMIDDAADMDLGPYGEVVSAPEPTDGFTVASDEIIFETPVDENLITEDEEGRTVPVTPENDRPELVSNRPYIEADDDMSDDEVQAVESYNDTQDEMVETARTMTSRDGQDDNSGAKKDDASDAFAKGSHMHTEHVNPNMTESTPQVQSTDFARTINEAATRYTSVDTRQIIEQIVTQVRTTVTENITTMSLELHPATLGKMYVQVTEQDGSVNAKLFTENETVKQAMETQMTSLKEEWEQQGMKVTEVEIEVATREFAQQMEAEAQANENQGRSGGEADAADESGASNNGIRNIDLSDGADGIPEDMTEAEALTASMMRDYGNRMNLFA